MFEGDGASSGTEGAVNMEGAFDGGAGVAGMEGRGRVLSGIEGG
jgi:hypothetical protein